MDFLLKQKSKLKFIITLTYKLQNVILHQCYYETLSKNVSQCTAEENSYVCSTKEKAIDKDHD